ncbi:hypothetical protein Taro_054877 [Colocasia esculenta]|uniref:Protein TIFY n=1 Tax=Colocasia esculenta TaxID=4460 RepID=A0A843XRS7_COLES|nr:hypothetical protein [Colocasia esculenta]
MPPTATVRRRSCGHNRPFCPLCGYGHRPPPPNAAQQPRFLGSSALNWPFSNKIPAMQQFMNIKVAQDERSKRFMFDQLSSSGLQPMSTVSVFDAVHRSPSMLVPQRYLGIDRQGIQQFQQPSYPALGADLFSGTSAVHRSNEVRMFPAVTPHSIPIATSCPFFKVSGSANGSSPGVTSLKQQPPFIGGSTYVTPESGSMTAASFASRNATKIPSTTAQLTIFYGGMVNVYDDVPLERAQAIMFLAANGSNMNSNVASVGIQKPVAAPPTKVPEDEAISMDQTKDMNQVPMQKNAVQPCTNQCTPMSTNPQGVAQLGNGHNSTDDLTGTRAAGPLVEPPRAIATACGSAAGASFIPRAIPQARKASLVRFLEKRKERVTIAAPYPLPHKSPECTSGCVFDGKSMTAETAHSSSQEQSWRLSTHKNSSSSSNSPSTKLEM